MRVLLLLFLLAAADDVRDELTGRWVGTSLCTEPRGACHDETASYRVTKHADAGKIAMSMNKMVNGEEQVMGVLDYTVDAKTHTIHAENESRYGRLFWNFHWDGTKMDGTLKLENGRVVRNIALKRE